ncbi:MAG TPA: ABC-F family ATP-binding cassette domain-containing protein [Oscillatoriaceae cyanobacterium]
MSLLSASRLAFRHPAAPQDLVADVTFHVNPGDRIALVGPNGAGKSTLLALMTGALSPTAGAIVRREGLRLATVDQVPEAPSSCTLLDYVMAAEPTLAALREVLGHLAERLDEPAAAARWADALDEYQARDGYAFEARAARVLEGLGLPAALHESPWGTLSSGQRTRGMLARVLLVPGDLLLLDEPTNHLDTDGRAWLEDWLRRQESALVVVSHDRAFLEAIAERVFELRAPATGGKAGLTTYEGDVGFFREAKELAERQAWAAYEGQQRRHTAAARAAEQRTALARDVTKTPSGQNIRTGKDFYKAKAAKVAKTAKVIVARSAREPEASKPVLDGDIPAFDWDFVPRSGDLALSVRGLAKAYGDRRLFSDLSFDLARGERLALLGANGVGKTTLLRVLLGQVPSDAGEVLWGHGVRTGWFGQEAEQLDASASALENLLAVRNEPARARLLLACLRLRGERAFQAIATMSAGERAKVALARLLLGGANVLLLDEPSNHLDLDTFEAMEATLSGFPGAIVLVSHDRRFVQAIAQRRLLLDGSGGRWL